VQANIIVASPMWSLSGVSVFSSNLVRGLRARGIPAHILLTQPKQLEAPSMPLPSDIPVEHLTGIRHDSWKPRWQAMVRYLEERAPCIYVPNSDFGHSCVSPKLSKRVCIIGIVHSDDPQHYEHVSRLGRYWNGIVAVSKAVAEKTSSLDPGFSQRLVVIPCGVAIPNGLPKRSEDSNACLKIVYAGRLDQRQKRILDLPKIAEALFARKIPFELTIIGGGSYQDRVLAASKHLIDQGVVRFLATVPNERVLEIVEHNHALVMTSGFEGMPIILLEAMGRGCVPVVTEIRSGIPELVLDGVNGCVVPVGAIDSFVDCLCKLQQNVNWYSTLSANAYASVVASGYRVEDMVQRYIELFQFVLRDAESGVYRRPPGPIVPPPSVRLSWKDRLPVPVRALAASVKQYLISPRHG